MPHKQPLGRDLRTKVGKRLPWRLHGNTHCGPDSAAEQNSDVSANARSKPCSLDWHANAKALWSGRKAFSALHSFCQHQAPFVVPSNTSRL